MKHSVVFKNTDNHWDNALPLGNGIFGAMVYFEKSKLHIPMNHYEVYYNIEENVLPKDKLANAKPCVTPGAKRDKILTRAKNSIAPDGESFSCYRSDRDSVNDTESAEKYFDGSYPKTGDLKFDFCNCMADADSTLTLYVEDAKTVLSLESAQKSVSVETLVAREDCVINHITQSQTGLLPSFELEFTPQRSLEMPEIEYEEIDNRTFAYTVKRALGKKTFVFSGVIRLVGALGTLSLKKHSAKITLTDADNRFYILTGVFTQFKYKNTLSDGVLKISDFEQRLPTLIKEHKTYWDGFFGRSSVTLPDKFLERVYIINQYALDCCSGKDGVMKHHACGLNGLWDIRHPSLWGSMWYWDVNIQAAFAGVFSSNRLELAKVFSDGLLTYVDLAKKAARDVHELHGIAGDYPYNFYFSVWAWCAQYLWFAYEYSLDKEYLEKDAFPVFTGLCEFYCELFKYDEERGYYSVYPDISPEQGPLSHNTVITVACVKYLFKFTLEAAKILGRDFDCSEKCLEILNNMAPYPLSKDGMYGVHFRDSEDAPDNLWIRHPGMLMPVFPIGEFDLENDKETFQIVSNTIDFLDEHCEIGIFGGSWLAAAAARLGRGQTAIRLLYERGIDHMLRTNGLTAEKTDRFINYCLTIRQPLYYPCMMEFTGEMLAATNEMLINSDNGVIKVFPAIPDGSPEYERSLRRSRAHQLHHDLYAHYEKWNDVRFDNLLAKGAFEVSASLTDRKLDFIKIHSKRGGKVRVTSPFIEEGYSVFCCENTVDFRFDKNIMEFETETDKTYTIALNAVVNTAIPNEDGYTDDVISRMTYTKRNIYIGEDAEASYRMAVDREMRDWYFGNLRIPNQTVYKIDFTNDTHKRYSDVLPRQTNCAEDSPVIFTGFLTVGDGNFDFTDYQGFGFDSGDAVIETRDGPDALRRDFVSGSEETEFVIEVPRGQYELFVVSGDCENDSVTLLSAENGITPKCTLTKKGEYQCKLIPVIVDDDENIRLRISTLTGYKWSINYIILNGIKGY